jgi:hypothetical protein
MAFFKPLIQRRRINWHTTTATFLVLVTTCSLAAKTLSAPPNEYQVKAALLFNFVKFVEWPPNAFADANTPFVIGVLGQDPFGSYLDDTVRGERWNGRPLVVQRYRSAGELKNCHVLFISRSESDRLDQILASLKYRKILTVTDAAGDNGGVIIRFINDGNRIRFKIDAQAAKTASLTISSKLLRLA